MVGRHGGERPGEDERSTKTRLFSHKRVTRYFYINVRPRGRVFRYTLFLHERAIRTEEGRFTKSIYIDVRSGSNIEGVSNQ